LVILNRPAVSYYLTQNFGKTIILRLSKNIILVFYFIYFGVALAEVKEDVYGKAQGYPIARGFPYSYEPKFRVGSYSGRATDEFYKDRDI